MFDFGFVVPLIKINFINPISWINGSDYFLSRPATGICVRCAVKICF